MSGKSTLIRPENLEQVLCNVCGATDYEIIGRQSRFSFPLTTVICRRCGLIYLNPRLTKQANDQFYEQAYRELLDQKDWPLEKYYEDQALHARERILEVSADYIPQGGRVLDIGCSTGGVLHTISQLKGCEAYGVEPSLAHSSFATERSGVKVRVGVFEDVVYEPSYFDFVLATQVLNHLLDPLGSLRKIRGILKPTGRLYLEVLNFVEATRLFSYNEDCITVDHPYMFCPESLEAIVRKAGFEIVAKSIDHTTSQNGSKSAGRTAPWTHMRVVCKPAEPVEAYADYQSIKRQIKSNRIQRFKKSIRQKTTYRKFAGSLIRKIFGQGVYEKLRSRS